MLNITLLPIENLNDAEVDVLVAILNNDQALQAWLGTPPDAPAISRQEFRQTAQDWMRSHNARTYCIYTQTPVGVISISHITPAGAARIGYWLTSREWRRGIGTAAFHLALNLAQEMGIHQANATIAQNNLASLRIWQQLGATVEPAEPGKVQVLLEI